MNGRVPVGGAALGIAVGVLVVAGFRPGAREPHPVPLPASGAHAPARPGLAVTAIANRVSGTATMPAARRTRAAAHERHTVHHRATRRSPRARHRAPAVVHPRAQTPTAPVRTVPSRPRPQPVTVPVQTKPAPAKPEPAPVQPKPAHAPKPEPAPATTFDDSG